MDQRRMRLGFDTATVRAAVQLAEYQLAHGKSGKAIAEAAKLMAQLAKIVRGHSGDAMALMALIDVVDRLAYAAGVPLGPAEVERHAVEEWVRFSIGLPGVPQRPPMARLHEAVTAWREPGGRSRAKWTVIAAFARSIGLHVSSAAALKKQRERWENDRAADDTRFRDQYGD